MRTTVSWETLPYLSILALKHSLATFSDTHPKIAKVKINNDHKEILHFDIYTLPEQSMNPPSPFQEFTHRSVFSIPLGYQLIPGVFLELYEVPPQSIGQQGCRLFVIPMSPP